MAPLHIGVARPARMRLAALLGAVLLGNALFAVAFGSSAEASLTGAESGQEGSEAGELTESEQKAARFLPTIYQTEPHDWGCCRLCGDDDPMVVRRGIPILINDPTRFYNCCPFCPWPPKDESSGKLGPYEMYFQPREVSLNDQYEAELKGFERPGIPKYKPADPDQWAYYNPAEENEDGVSRPTTFIEDEAHFPSLGGLLGGGAKATGSLNLNLKVGGSLTGSLAATAAGAIGAKAAPAKATSAAPQTSHAPNNVNAKGGSAAAPQKAASGSQAQSEAGDPDQAGPYNLKDPYVVLRGAENPESQTYVYGAPGDDGATFNNVPKRPDLPPCCNICERSHETLQPKGDPSCCVHCATTLIGKAPWRTRREKIAMEEENEKRMNPTKKDQQQQQQQKAAAADAQKQYQAQQKALYEKQQAQKQQKAASKR